MAHDLIRMLLALAFGFAGAGALHWLLTRNVPRHRSRRND